jgi:hypothetical protein
MAPSVFGFGLTYLDCFAAGRISNRNCGDRTARPFPSVRPTSTGGITQYLLAYLARPRAERIFSLQRRKEELLEVQLDWILRVRLRKVQFKVFIGVILVV